MDITLYTSAARNLKIPVIPVIDAMLVISYPFHQIIHLRSLHDQISILSYIVSMFGSEIVA